MKTLSLEAVSADITGYSHSGEQAPTPSQPRPEKVAQANWENTGHRPRYPRFCLTGQQQLRQADCPILGIYPFIYVFGWGSQGTCGGHLPPWRSWGLNSGSQAQQQVPFQFSFMKYNNKNTAAFVSFATSLSSIGQQCCYLYVGDLVSKILRPEMGPKDHLLQIASLQSLH